MKTIHVVIAELELVLAIVAENPSDSRLKPLLDQTAKDLSRAANAILSGGQDPIADDNPSDNGPK